MMEGDYLSSYLIDPSNLQLKEYFRKEGIVFDPVNVYARKHNLFSIKLHHGGKFIPSPNCGHYKELLWKCATATTEVHFKRAMDEFKGYNRLAHEWLRKISPKHWSRSQFSSGRANCDLLINNICEVFNRQLLKARDSPVITALEYVREYLMKRIMIVQKASECVVAWNGAGLFQVNEGRQNQVVVNLSNKSCTCRKWEVSGIPCKHAVACIFNMTDNGMQVGLPEDWVHQSMRLQTWKTVYSFKINPVPGRQFWAKSQVPSRLIPPYIPPQVGRPSKKRKKSAGEVTEMVKDGKLTRKGGTVTCCKCGQKGHNKRSCKGPSASASASQPARAPSASASASQPARAPSASASASQPARASASGSTSGPRSGSQPARASASASQPARAPSASASASQPARASASQPVRVSASASASAKQPQRPISQPASAPKTTRQTKTKNVAASAKKTPTRQSQRQKSAKKTPTTK
ncbi:mutator type transposase [Tanacetum coccineum]